MVLPMLKVIEGLRSRGGQEEIGMKEGDMSRFA